jgi:hypothetical protein
MGSPNSLYVFLFCFAFGYLIAGKNAMLRLSTRIVLIVLFGCALLFATSTGSRWHETVGVATIIANTIFLTFGVMDYLAFVKGDRGRV